MTKPSSPESGDENKERTIKRERSSLPSFIKGDSLRHSALSAISVDDEHKDLDSGVGMNEAGDDKQSDMVGFIFAKESYGKLGATAEEMNDDTENLKSVSFDTDEDFNPSTPDTNKSKRGTVNKESRRSSVLSALSGDSFEEADSPTRSMSFDLYDLTIDKDVSFAKKEKTYEKSVSFLDAEEGRSTTKFIKNNKHGKRDSAISDAGLSISSEEIERRVRMRPEEARAEADREKEDKDKNNSSKKSHIFSQLAQRIRFSSFSSFSSYKTAGSDNEDDNKQTESRKRSGRTLWLLTAARKMSIVIRKSDIDDDEEENGDDDNEEEEKKMEYDNENTPLIGSRNSKKGSDCSCFTRQPHKKKKKNKKKTKTKTLDFTLFEATVAIVLYLLLSVLAYSVLFDHWPVVDSLYFAVVTFTTIGYGDLVPDTVAGKVFACFFGWSGVALLGIALGILGSNLVEAELNLIKMSQEASRRRIIGIFDVDKKEEIQEEEKKHTEADEKWLHKSFASGWQSFEHLDSSEDSGREELPPPVKKKPPSSSSSSASTKSTKSPFSFLSSSIFAKMMSVLFFLLLGSFYIAHLENWDIADTCYYCIVTSCTIGFGDFSPTHPHTRAFAIIFIPLAVGAMGEFLSTVAGHIIEGRQKEFRDELRTKELTPADLEKMKTSSDESEVTKLDYVEFMLTSMQLVSRDVLEEIHDQFDRLDETKSGTITKEDLKLLAMKKMKSVRKKLELAEYKRLLLQKERKNSPQ